jgi:hypothetical protein
MEIRFGPVTNGLEISPTGSKDHYCSILATKLVIASTGAMLVIGHEAPVEVLALAAEPHPELPLQKRKL